MLVSIPLLYLKKINYIINWVVYFLLLVTFGMATVPYLIKQHLLKLLFIEKVYNTNIINIFWQSFKAFQINLRNF